MGFFGVVGGTPRETVEEGGRFVRFWGNFVGRATLG
jgi:hypothetical protein